MLVHPAGAVGTTVPVPSWIMIWVIRVSPAKTPGGTATTIAVIVVEASVSTPAFMKVMLEAGVAVGVGVGVAVLVAVGVAVAVAVVVGTAV